MPPLPRGKCSVCEQSVPIRVNGDAREHYDDYKPQREQDVTTHRGRMHVCEGSGKPVVR